MSSYRPFSIPLCTHLRCQRECIPRAIDSIGRPNVGSQRLHTLAWLPLIRPSEKPHRQRAWSHGHLILTSANVMLRTAILLETVFLVHVAWHAYHDKTSKRFADAQILRLLLVTHFHCSLQDSMPVSHHGRTTMGILVAAQNTKRCRPLFAFTSQTGRCRYRCHAAAGSAHCEPGLG